MKTSFDTGAKQNLERTGDLPGAELALWRAFYYTGHLRSPGFVKRLGVTVQSLPWPGSKSALLGGHV